MKKLLLSILGMLLLSTQIAVAQMKYMEGYIVKIDNDTVPGFINYRAWEMTPQDIKFKRTEDGTVEKLGILDLNAFYVNKEHYVARDVEINRASRTMGNISIGAKMEITKERLFLQVLFKGAADLYYYYDESQNSHFFIEKEDVPIAELIYHFTKVEKDGKIMLSKKTRYRGQLLYHMRDCKELESSINQLAYNRNSFFNLFGKYNACTGEQQAYEYDPKQMTSEVSLIVGGSYTTIDLGATVVASETSFEGSFAPTFGVGLNLALRRKNRRLSIYNDLLLRSYTTTGYRRADRVLGEFEEFNFDIRFTYLKLSSMMRYYWRTPNVNIFLGAGVSNGLAIRSKQEFTQTKSWLPGETTIDIYEEGARAHEIGFVGAFGLSLKKINLELRYESANGFRKNSAGSSAHVRTKALMFLLGYRIK